LEEIGFVWNSYAADWEEGFALLKQFNKREGHCRMLTTHKEGDYRLGGWVSRQRDNKDSLSPQRRQRLDEIGLVWDVLAAAWEEGFAALLVFKQREGHCRMRAKHKEGDYRLGQWVSVQRTDKDSLSPQRRQRLEEIGFVWDLRAQQWEEGFALLKQFNKREGHCRVPQGYKEGAYRLGGWIREQRANKDTLSPERRQRLDEIGFVWDPHSAYWEEGFALLKQFNKREGHCRVAHNYKEGDYKLGPWATRQRTNKDALSPERRQRLEEIGFVWNTRVPLSTDN
jgi:DNA-binding TFAR19-related protein (PDSD5 family)